LFNIFIINNEESVGKIVIKENVKKEINWSSFLIFSTYSIIWRIMRGERSKEDKKFREIWGVYYY
jgi:hypothetical protein